MLYEQPTIIPMEREVVTAVQTLWYHWQCDFTHFLKKYKGGLYKKLGQ